MKITWFPYCWSFMVGRGGVEPPFSVFQTGAPTVYAICPYFFKTQCLFCKMLDSNQRPIVYQTIAHPSELISLQSYLLCVPYTKIQNERRNHYDFLVARGGTRTHDFHLMRVTRQPLLYSAMGAAGGFEPRIQVMNLVSYLQTTTAISEGGVFFRSEPPRPHMKGNENRKVAGGKAENILSQAMRITLENFSFIIQYS